MVKQGTIGDATKIAAPSSIKNNSGTREPEMHQTRKGKQWYPEIKAHMGSAVEIRLMHTVEGTASNVVGVTVASDLLHGAGEMVLAGAGY